MPGRNKRKKRRAYDEGNQHPRKRQKTSNASSSVQFQRRVTYTDQYPDLSFLFPPTEPGKTPVIDLSGNEIEYKKPGVIFVTKLRARTRRKKMHTYIQKFVSHFHCFIAEDNTAQIVMENPASAQKFLADSKADPFTQGQSDPDMMPKFTIINFDEYKAKNFWLFVNPTCRNTLWNFSEGCQQHFIESRAGPEENTLKAQVMELLRVRVRHAFPSANPSVILFGSAMCGLDSSMSDLDVAVKTGSKDARDMKKQEERRLLIRIKNSLAQHQWFVQGRRAPYRFKIIPILNAKVPILMVTDPMCGIQIDVSLYREQTQVGLWICRLCEFDNRVRTFLIALKFWSKQRGVNNAKNGFINSFGWVMLGLKYLQFISPAVIPVVDIQDFLDEKVMKNFKQRNRMDQGTLLFGFFTFYSEFDFSTYEICVRQKELLRKRYNEWTKVHGLREDQQLVIIEDPFQLDNNVARNVRMKALDAMHSEFLRGRTMCQSFTPSTFEELCSLSIH